MIDLKTISLNGKYLQTKDNIAEALTGEAINILTLTHQKIATGVLILELTKELKESRS